MSETPTKPPKPAPTPVDTKAFIFDVHVGPIGEKPKTDDELMIEAMKANLFKEDGEAYFTFRSNICFQEKEKVPSRAEDLKD
jgi:hypothetical protein